MGERLYRSRRDRVLGGVAVGLAEYWHMDPIVVRILFIIVAMMTGIGFILYIVLWVIIPEEPYPFTDFGHNYGGRESKSESQTISDSAESSETKEDNSDSNFEYKYNFENHNYTKKGNPGRVIGGIILIVMGLFFLAERIFPYFDFMDVLPLLLIGVGLVLILNSNRNKKNAF